MAAAIWNSPGWLLSKKKKENKNNKGKKNKKEQAMMPENVVCKM